jgi:hypothetical protein
MIGSRRRLLTYATGNRQKRICIIVVREEFGALPNNAAIKG